MIRTILCLSFLLFSFVFGAVVSGINMWFQPIVTLNIENKMQETISKLRVRWRSDTIQLETIVSHLYPNESVTLNIVASGGGVGYQVDFKMDDKESYVSSNLSNYVTPGKYSIELK